MDAATLGAVCGLAGTVAGAAVAYFGPLQLERRRERVDREARLEERIRADIGRYVAARAAADQWLDLLRRGYQAALERRLDLDQFDADVARCSDELRLRLADLTYVGISEPDTNPAFTTFRRAAGDIKRLAADDSAPDGAGSPGGEGAPGEPGAGEERGAAALRRVEACAAERTNWARGVLDALSLHPGVDLSAGEGRAGRGAVP